MIDWALNLWANRWIAFGLYWLPLAFCAFGYFVRSWRDVAKDHAARAEAELYQYSGDKSGPSYYHPSITIGTLLGRGIVSIVPVANLFAAAFNVAPELFGDFFRWLARVFDQPLVPKRERVVETR